MLEKEFIPYEQALALKELGFDEPCFGWFTFGHLRKGTIVENKHVQGEGELLAPTYSQVFRWFRDKYDLLYYWENPKLKEDYYWDFLIYNEITGEKIFVVRVKYNEEAELECLRKLIEIVKNK